MRTNLAILLTAGVLAFAGANAFANRPAARLPDGDIVDLNTGVATTPDGRHYKVSPAELQTLLRQPGHTGAASQQTAAPPATGPKPEQTPPPR